MSRALATLSDGWNQLRERTAHALTHFQSVRAGSDIEANEDVIVRRCAPWGLIPSEVIEEEQNLLVRLEIPGMERSDFDLEVVGDILVVRGEKRVRGQRETGRYTFWSAHMVASSVPSPCRCRCKKVGPTPATRGAFSASCCPKHPQPVSGEFRSTASRAPA